MRRFREQLSQLVVRRECWFLVIMASSNIGSLPMFPSFDAELDRADVATRWTKWLARLENLFVALNIADDKRKRALLLHFAGEQVHDIFDAESSSRARPATTSSTTSTTSTAATAPDCSYAGTVQVLTTYFAPKRNIQMEVYVFRSCKQKPGQSLEAYVTELRALAQTCHFHDANSEILSQLIQHCSSLRFRRRALREQDKSLSDILAMGRLLEQSDAQAKLMEEGPASVNAVQNARPRPWSQKRSSRSSSSNICNYCGGRLPHSEDCPARGKTCKFCHKKDHFERVCRSKARSQEKVKAVSNAPEGTDCKSPVSQPHADSSSDEYCYAVQEETVSAVRPHATLMVEHVPITFLIDTGTTVNIIDETAYELLGKPALLTTRGSRLVPYGSAKPLQLLGRCNLSVERDGNTHSFVFNVVAGRYGCLLSCDAALALEIVQLTCAVADYKSRFPQLSKGIGKLKDKQFLIHVDKAVPPVAITNRRTPFHLREKVAEELDKLLEEDVIEKVVGEPTPWVSPIVTPPKKDGSIRLCVDMRRPNKAIKRERHSTPTVDELLTDLNGAKIFSKIDLRAGYHQLELAPESRYITTFATHRGLYRYKRLNFGISSASEIFQEAIRDVIRDIKGTKNISDDIICFGSGNDAQADHDRAVHDVLTKLQQSGLTVNWNKCEFGVRRIEFFGLIFSDQGVSPDPKKVAAIKEAAPPCNPAEVRSLLGMLNYSARFIKDYASLSEPLRRLTVKDAEWVWHDEQQAAFDSLKSELMDSTIMAYYDPTADIEIFTDASPVGLGAILSQHDKPVAFASRALSHAESRYSQTEREALAVVWACEHFDLYVRGAPQFSVITDHKPLLHVWDKPKPPLRLERWGLRLQPYKLCIKFRPGRDNPADYMSRHPRRTTSRADEHSQKLAEQYVCFVAQTSTPSAMTLSEIAEAAIADKTLMKAIEFTRSGRWHDLASVNQPDIDIRELQEYRNVKDDFTCYNDIVLLREKRIVVPATLRDHVVSIAHEGHQGVSRTKSFLRSKVWFPGMDSKVEAAIRLCPACQAVQDTHTPLEPLRMSSMPPGPWQHVSMDFCGPLPTGDYLMVLIDEFSRYPVVEIIKSVSASTVLPVLDKVLSVFGFPVVLKSDNGSPFNSDAFARYAKHSGFAHRRITPHWPRANSQAEAFNKPLMKAIRAAYLEQQNWKQQMFVFLRQYRATPHTTTGVTPFQLMFSREPSTRLPTVPLADSGCHSDDKQLDHQRALKKAISNDAVAKSKQKQYADSRKRARVSDIAVGDSVLLRRDKRGDKFSTPFIPHPMIVIARKGNMITAETSDRRITRNVSFFKKVSFRSSPFASKADVDNDDDDIPIPGHHVDVPPAPQTHLRHPAPSSRPSRTRRRPQYLKDFVP